MAKQNKLQAELVDLVLQLCGDVEVNPGPYNILKCVKASFSQAHEKFGYTRGLKNTCMSLYAVCYSKFKHLSRWTK